MSVGALPDDLRGRSARLARWGAWLLATLSVLLVLERFSAAALAYVHGDPGALRTMTLQAVRSLPEVCYLLGLFWVRRALAELSHGAFHTPVLAMAFRRVGVLLTVGAALKVGVLPTLEQLLGASPGYVVAYDVESLVLCAVGLALAMLAQVLKRAAAVQAELDEIF